MPVAVGCWLGPSPIPIWARRWRSASAVAGPVLAAGLRSACCRSRTQKSTLIDSGDGVAAQLDGFRGSPLLDREALRELMLRFALLLRECPHGGRG
jgi:hypothetical protein